MLAGCGGGSVALPPQRRTYAGPERREFGDYARVAEARYAGNLVRGLRPSGRWAWTARRAELRFWVEPGPRRFTADFFVAVDTFKKTGPFTVSFLVNGKRVGSVRCDGAREFSFDSPVPEAWIDPSRPVEVALEADKVWVAPDGVEYGFLLVSAGFQPR